MVEVRLSRYRDGAVGWALSRDVSDPTHWVETFRTRDWHELQRGFERLNLADSREDQCLREPPTRHSQRHGSGPCRTVQRGAHCQQDSQRQQERGIKASQRRNEREDHGRSEHQHVGQDQVALAVHQVGQSSGRERKNKHRELRGGRDQADHQWTWRQVRHDPSAGGVLDPGPQGGDSIGQPQPERSHRQPREQPAQRRTDGAGDIEPDRGEDQCRASHRRGTVSGTEAAHAGLFNAAPTASRTVNDSRSVASRRPSAATSARITAAASISMLVRIRWRLRSIKSAKAPAGSARTSTGSCAAAGTKLTINGLGDRSVMIQALAVFWIQVPRAEIVLASHSQKNARLANGAPAECAVRSGSSAE